MLKWPSSLLELEEKECCWSPDPRLWSRFSFWMPENIHPSSASLAESSSDGFKWEPWRPRQGGGYGSLGNWWHWEGGLSSSSLLLPLLPVLLVVEVMGNAGVEACLDWFAAQRQTVVAARFLPLTQFEPALLPSLDLLHWQRWKSVFVSSQPVARVSMFKLEILSMWSLTNLKLTITSSFHRAPGENLLSLKLGKMLKCCTKFDSYTALGCLGVRMGVLFCCSDCSHRSSFNMASDELTAVFPHGAVNSNWPFTSSSSTIFPAVSPLVSV